MEKRESWGSNLGFILSSIGGALGLGAIWKFPYTVGANGGAAFLIIFLIALFLIATPILILEYAIGRKTKLSYISALKELFPKKSYYMLGYVGLLVITIVLSFYLGVSGWSLAYLYKSLTSSYSNLSPQEITKSFSTFLNSPLELIFWQFIMTFVTCIIVIKGIRNGIEKICTILLPFLFIMIIGLAIKSSLLPGAEKGLEFYLKPDFSLINFNSIINAVGLAFFTLGVGSGNLVVYGSYLNKNKTITHGTIAVVFGDILAAILMGLIIFPSIFAYNIEPTAGPPLVFIALPIIFSKMDYGMIIGSIFYLLLFFACLTSTICILEAIVSYFVDELKWKRKTTVFFCSIVIFIIGVFQMLSFGPLSDFLIFDKTIFEFSDYLVTNILLPGSGLLMVLIFGWKTNTDDMIAEINDGSGIKINNYYKITIKYFSPIFLLLVYLQLLGLF
ncbi:MAG: sodium-dependent transporter [Cetobacterium sp.]|uniref:sodium-dependent transporter n=1 Tax=Cetobacterium sp. TaxID=2071632 RepID=UPI002FC89DF5